MVNFLCTKVTAVLREPSLFLLLLLLLLMATAVDYDVRERENVEKENQNRMQKRVLFVPPFVLLFLLLFFLFLLQNSLRFVAAAAAATTKTIARSPFVSLANGIPPNNHSFIFLSLSFVGSHYPPAPLF